MKQNSSFFYDSNEHLDKYNSKISRQYIHFYQSTSIKVMVDFAIHPTLCSHLQCLTSSKYILLKNDILYELLRIYINHFNATPLN